MTTRISGNGRAAASIVTRSSTSARIATADIATAARNAVIKRVGINDAALTAGISEAKKEGWIIATGNAPIDIAGARPRRT